MCVGRVGLAAASLSLVPERRPKGGRAPPLARFSLAAACLQGLEPPAAGPEPFAFRLSFGGEEAVSPCLSPPSCLLLPCLSSLPLLVLSFSPYLSLPLFFSLCWFLSHPHFLRLAPPLPSPCPEGRSDKLRELT